MAEVAAVARAAEGQPEGQPEQAARLGELVVAAEPVPGQEHVAAHAVVRAGHAVVGGAGRAAEDVERAAAAGAEHVAGDAAVRAAERAEQDVAERAGQHVGVRVVGERGGASRAPGASVLRVLAAPGREVVAAAAEAAAVEHGPWPAERAEQHDAAGAGHVVDAAAAAVVAAAAAGPVAAAVGPRCIGSPFAADHAESGRAPAAGRDKSDCTRPRG